MRTSRSYYPVGVVEIQMLEALARGNLESRQYLMLRRCKGELRRQIKGVYCQLKKNMRTWRLRVILQRL